MTNTKIPNHYQEYKHYIVERLEQYPLACYKTKRRLWARQMRLAVAAGAKVETLFKINPHYNKLKLQSQINWFRRTHVGKPNAWAFMEFAKLIGAPTYKEFVSGVEQDTARLAAHPSGIAQQDVLAEASQRPVSLDITELQEDSQDGR